MEGAFTVVIMRVIIPCGGSLCFVFFPLHSPICYYLRSQSLRRVLWFVINFQPIDELIITTKWRSRIWLRLLSSLIPFEFAHFHECRFGANSFPPHLIVLRVIAFWKLNRWSISDVISVDGAIFEICNVVLCVTFLRAKSRCVVACRFRREPIGHEISKWIVFLFVSKGLWWCSRGLYVLRVRLCHSVLMILLYFIYIFCVLFLCFLNAIWSHWVPSGRLCVLSLFVCFTCYLLAFCYFAVLWLRLNSVDSDSFPLWLVLRVFVLLIAFFIPQRSLDSIYYGDWNYGDSLRTLFIPQSHYCFNAFHFVDRFTNLNFATFLVSKYIISIFNCFSFIRYTMNIIMIGERREGIDYMLNHIQSSNIKNIESLKILMI